MEEVINPPLYILGRKTVTLVALKHSRSYHSRECVLLY